MGVEISHVWVRFPKALVVSSFLHSFSDADEVVRYGQLNTFVVGSLTMLSSRLVDMTVEFTILQYQA
jgi:hypothetical protein